MLLYTVTYPHKADMDRDVPWSYLETLAKEKRSNGARATCTNGEHVTYVLVDGTWEDAR